MLNKFLRLAAGMLVALAGACLAGGKAPASDSLFQADHAALVSRADLDYDHPVRRSEDGMPVGNGRMGSLVWTTPSSLKFQINRVDVFAANCETNSFMERHSDYASGCGYVDVHFVGFGEDVFTTGSFRQRLSLYDGLMTAEGKGVTARVLAWPARDVMAVEIEDNRPQASAVNVDLRMLRYDMQYFPGLNYSLTKNHEVMVERRSHTATSKLDVRNGRIILTQRFREGDFHDASAVAIAVVGRESKARYLNDYTAQISAAPGRGKFTILITSAARFDPKADVAALALAELDVAAAKCFDALRAETASWWRDFWARGFVRLHSADGVADFVEQHYTYFLYVMASSSRGDYPPRFGGMIWYTNSDMREWGSMHWWANTACYYDGLSACNRPELMEPVFSMYSGMYDSAARAASQQWGSKGIFIGETSWFDGMENLPPAIAEEMPGLYLGRKPWEERSEAFKRYAETKSPHNSRWNWKDKGRYVDGRWVWQDRGKGPRGNVVTIFSSGAKIAYQYYLQYQYTQDKEFLRNRAYPMLKGVAEFYRNYPNVKKGPDGKYHIHDVNNSEPVWGASDTQEEVSAMHGTFPLAIRASEILKADPDLRAKWREFLRNLVALPTNDMLRPLQTGEAKCWISGIPPAVQGDPARSSLLPALYYDLCTVETADPEVLKIGNDTYDRVFSRGVGASTPVSVLSTAATAATHLGRGEHLKYMLPNQIRCLEPDRDFCDFNGSGRFGALMNRMTLREGPGAIGVERLGRVARALHEALLPSSPPEPGGEPVIRVFAAWPKEWDAEFKLLARGAFEVTSAMKSGKIDFVELRSKAGTECRLRNPWGDKAVSLFKNGRKWRDLAGSLLTFPTERDDLIVVVEEGVIPSAPAAR